MAEYVVTQPKIEIESDEVVVIVHADGQRFPTKDRAWVQSIRRAVAKGETMPNLIRNGKEKA